MKINYEEEHQEIIVHSHCPTKGCNGHTFLSIPEQYNDNLECKICGKTTLARNWLT